MELKKRKRLESSLWRMSRMAAKNVFEDLRKMLKMAGNFVDEKNFEQPKVFLSKK